MIEKVIHYCWFGGNEKPKTVLDCINSWKKFFPGYIIKEWNETNFDLKCYPYVEEAYRMKKWAFVTDVARLKIIYENGGIYFDTDVEVIKPFGEIVKQRFFLGLEEHDRINTGVGFGAEKESEIVKAMLDAYQDVHFLDDKCKVNPIVCPVYNTKALVNIGLKFENGITQFRGGSIYPEDYFSPIGLRDGILRLTANTLSIHHFQNTWMTPWQRIIKKLRRRYGYKYLSPIYHSLKKYSRFKLMDEKK